ncbi:MAG: hypothetical protein HoeaKO_42360 [Hoeflea alexandrii]
MSGYDKSPDYGGPKPSKAGFWLWLLCMVVLFGLILWWRLS